MADGDDLPDHDYESIYGRAAMWARQLARLDGLLAKYDAREAVLTRMQAASRPRDEEAGA